MPKPKGATSFRLSADAQGLLGELSGALGISKTAVLELALRRLARAELPNSTPRPKTSPKGAQLGAEGEGGEEQGKRRRRKGQGE